MQWESTLRDDSSVSSTSKDPHQFSAFGLSLLSLWGNEFKGEGIRTFANALSTNKWLLGINLADNLLTVDALKTIELALKPRQISKKSTDPQFTIENSLISLLVRNNPGNNEQFIVQVYSTIVKKLEKNYFVTIDPLLENISSRLKYLTKESYSLIKAWFLLQYEEYCDIERIDEVRMKDSDIEKLKLNKFSSSVSQTHLLNSQNVASKISNSENVKNLMNLMSINKNSEREEKKKKYTTINDNEEESKKEWNLKIKNEQFLIAYLSLYSASMYFINYILQLTVVTPSIFGNKSISSLSASTNLNKKREEQDQSTSYLNDHSFDLFQSKLKNDSHNKAVLYELSDDAFLSYNNNNKFSRYNNEDESIEDDIGLGDDDALPQEVEQRSLNDSATFSSPHRSPHRASSRNSSHPQSPSVSITNSKEDKNDIWKYWPENKKGTMIKGTSSQVDRPPSRNSIRPRTYQDYHDDIHQSNSYIKSSSKLKQSIDDSAFQNKPRTSVIQLGSNKSSKLLGRHYSPTPTPRPSSAPSILFKARSSLDWSSTPRITDTSRSSTSKPAWKPNNVYAHTPRIETVKDREFDLKYSSPLKCSRNKTMTTSRPTTPVKNRASTTSPSKSFISERSSTSSNKKVKKTKKKKAQSSSQNNSSIIYSHDYYGQKSHNKTNTNVLNFSNLSETSQNYSLYNNSSYYDGREREDNYYNSDRFAQLVRQRLFVNLNKILKSEIKDQF